MNTKLLNFLAQNFKEKRLIFQDAPGGAPKGVEDKEAGVSRPIESTDAGAERAAARSVAADVAADGLDEDESQKVKPPTEEPSIVSFISQDSEGYHYTGNMNNPQLNDIRRIESGVYAIGYQYDIYNGKKWIEFQPAWVASAAPAAPAPAAGEAAPAAPDADEQAARELEAAKGRLTAAKEKVAGEKAKVTQDILRTKVKERLAQGDEQLKDEIAKIIFPDGFDADIDDDFKKVTDKLTEADALTDPAAIDTKIKEAETALQALTPEKYITNRSEAIDKHKPLLALFDQLKAIGKEGTHAKTVLDEIRAAIVAALGKEEDPSTIPDKIKSDFSEKLAIAFVADTIEVTPEDFQAAIRFYKLGQYRVLNETHPKFQKNKEILDKFVAAKKDGKLNGITFDFFGSTNNVDHSRTVDLAWHQEKAAALIKILELNTVGRLQVDAAIARFITDNTALIRQYTTEVATGDKAKYMKVVDDNKDKFLKGGTIFDLALRLQRASEFKRLVEDKSKPADGEKYTDIFVADGKDKIELRHKADKSDDAMSSGIKVRLADDVFTPPAAPGAQGGGTPAGAPAPADNPEVQTNTNDHAYVIEPDGRLKVTFKGEDEPKYYTIVKPDNITLQPAVTDDGKDQYIRFLAKGRTDGENGYFEFEGKKFKSETNDYPDFIYTATFDESSSTITITATPVAPTAAPAEGTAETPQQQATKLVDEAIRLWKEAQAKTGQEKGDLTRQAFAKVEEAKQIDPPNAEAYRVRFIAETVPGTGGAAAAADAPAAAPGGNREALATKDRETTEALRTKLTEAKTEIDNLITKFEGTIGTNEKLAPTVASEVATKKAQMEATFEQVKGKLQDALDKTASGNFLGAEAAYKEAEKIITDTLNEEMEPNFKEAFLSEESKNAIGKLRAAVTKHKPLVEAAFRAKEEAVRALGPGE